VERSVPPNKVLHLTRPSGAASWHPAVWRCGVCLGRWAAQVSSDPSLYAVVMSRRRQSRDDAG